MVRNLMPKIKYSGQKIIHYPEFSPIFKKWRYLIEKYCEEVNIDVPYYYTERALIGTFATATWLVGDISLEEFSIEKGKLRGRGEQRWTGRVDIWVFPLKPRHSRHKTHGFYLESKHMLQSIGPRVRLCELQKRCKNLLDKAKEDAKKLKIHGGKRLGLLFVTPYLPKKEEKNIDECIRSFLSQLKKLDVDMAWTFPALSNSYVAPKFKHKYYNYNKDTIYPGIAILIR